MQKPRDSDCYTPSSECVTAQLISQDSNFDLKLREYYPEQDLTSVI
jgi:hypothetical protein